MNRDYIRLKRMYKEGIMKQLTETYSCLTNERKYVAISQDVRKTETLTPAAGAQIEKKVRKMLKMEEPANG